MTYKYNSFCARISQTAARTECRIPRLTALRADLRFPDAGSNGRSQDIRSSMPWKARIVAINRNGHRGR